MSQQGTVKFFSDQKGFGFITPTNGGQDVFVHQSDIKMDGFRTLQEGQNVAFETMDTPRGPKAVNVTPTA
jgi:CspA family cold shock protein